MNPRLSRKKTKLTATLMVELGIFLSSLTACFSAQTEIQFNRDILPILSDKCFHCHGPDDAAREADLRLDTHPGAIADLGGYAAIAPGHAEKSELIQRIRHDDKDEVMPPIKTNKNLSPKEKELLTQWINEGAEYQAHWSFLPLDGGQVPQVKNKKSVKNDVDRFIIAKLEKQGLSPSPEADPSTLVRRLYIDLLGLLPPPELVKKFRDSYLTHPEASYAELVDALLNSPHYGERWARHWLDQARYADSNGYTVDRERVMWPYRDWVIRAVGDDLPFDQFTIEQIAGDLLPEPKKSQLVATGFHRNTLINQEGGVDHEQFRIEEVIDRVNTTSAVWLGLTVGCAQCHNHKFDPISQKEFYQLFAFFNSTEDVNNTGPTLEVSQRELFIDQFDPKISRLLQNTRNELAMLARAKPLRQTTWEKNKLIKLSNAPPPSQKTQAAVNDKKLLSALRIAPEKRNSSQKKRANNAFDADDHDRKAVLKKIDLIKSRLGMGPAAKTMITRELKEPRLTYLLTRGNFLLPDKKAGPIQANVPAILNPLKVNHEQSANRLDLAHWLVSPDNPLTPRVTVNRVWMRYFGKGLVSTENDFGTQGSYPTHPALLDWLASQFIHNGWSMRKLHKLIVTSATYRQASHHRPGLKSVDARNTLLAKQNRLRFDAEIIRDASLTASGLLTATIGGPSVHPPQPDGVYAFTQNKKTWNVETDSNRYRRALYTQFYRSAPYPMLTTFDSPDFQSVCTQRTRSNTPLQALTLANDETLFEMSQGLAQRLMLEIPGNDAPSQQRRIRRAYVLCFSRQPSDSELNRVATFQKLQQQHFAENAQAAKTVAPSKTPSIYGTAEAASWTAVARALMNTDEFITRE
ncbi:MAG: PSD1 and planctomycete cytochrome C domain-containing protein [Verrucomicrobiales bacterium]|nr:PSD1 and planctomycete cytochrome C domain-containing protein [Verrucomicrobiales bacterium]